VSSKVAQKTRRRGADAVEALWHREHVPAALEHAAQRAGEAGGDGDGAALGVELERDAVSLDEGGGELALAKFLIIGEGRARGLLVKSSEGAAAEGGAADLQDLEEVEEDVAEVALVVRGGGCAHADLTGWLDSRRLSPDFQSARPASARRFAFARSTIRVTLARRRRGDAPLGALMCRIFGFRSVIQSQVHRSLVSADNALMIQGERHPDGWGGRVLRGRRAARGEERVLGGRGQLVPARVGGGDLRDGAGAPAQGDARGALVDQHAPVPVRPLGVRPQRQHRRLRRAARGDPRADPGGAAALHPRAHGQRGALLFDPRKDVAAPRAAPPRLPARVADRGDAGGARGGGGAGGGRSVPTHMPLRTATS
jgi:hypothetical protein